MSRNRFQPGYKVRDKTGVLLVNLGTPDSPTPRAIRRYLRQFLQDLRVVEIPRWLWWPILNLIILPLRSRRVAKAYKRIWSGQGSPLLTHSVALAKRLSQVLDSDKVIVEAAMRYGKPSIARGMQRLFDQGIGCLLVLPLYPQYASATTASVYDAIGECLRRYRFVPPVHLLGDYHDHPAYISAVAASIAAHRSARGGDAGFLLFSFHGLPEDSRKKGDPYYEQCRKSARLIAQEMGLSSSQWGMAFQSRFGREEWLKPYCVDFLAQLPRRGVKTVDVVCPGFAVDCLETLDEIAIENSRVFLAAGGERYEYVPALNATHSHAEMIAYLLKHHLSDYEHHVAE